MYSLVFLFGCIALGAAIYTTSYGIWTARQKNWLGAVGLWFIALMTITAPLGVFLFRFLRD